MAVRSLRLAATSERRPGRREQQRIETRGRLFDAAMEEFRDVGLAAAQVDHIVEKAGVSRGTFYFHFPSKEHVLLEAQTRAEAEIVERLHANGPPPESVRDYLRLLFACIQAVHEQDESLRREVLAMYIRQPIQLELAAQPVIVELFDFFSDASERGEVRSDVPSEQLAIHFMQLIPFLLLADGERADGPGPPADGAIEIFLTGAVPRR